MEHTKSIARLATPLIFTTVIFLILLVPSASACSLASPVPYWLQYVLGHGLATLNPDCTLTWKTGVVTDLKGNLVPPPINTLIQQYGIAFFVAGTILATIGIYLIVKSRHLAKSMAKANLSTQPV